MTIQALYSAATGMTGMETKLDTVANNLANMNTTAFKRDRANFEDLIYHHEQFPGIQDSAGQYTPTGTQIGMGVRMQSTQTEFTEGTLSQTGQELDVAIEGTGFFQVTSPDGTIEYTRAGNFSKNANGNLVTGSANDGLLLEPPIVIPPDAQAVSISPEGVVSVQQQGSNQMSQVGQIQLAAFINPQGLLKLGQNLYRETDASGAPTISNPGQNGVGTLQQGMLESSNVEPVQELIDMITTQRAFELNSQAVKAADELLQTVANLPRAT